MTALVLLKYDLDYFLVQRDFLLKLIKENESYVTYDLMRLLLLNSKIEKQYNQINLLKNIFNSNKDGMIYPESLLEFYAN